MITKCVERIFRNLLLLCFLLGVPSLIVAQEYRVGRYSGVGGYSVVFWNIENFFDLLPSPQHLDSGFTPRGEMRWTRKKFNAKRDGLAKVLIATGSDGELPAIIGLAEIENRYVLNQLVYETPLYNGNYRIVHKDSPDRRGIDVALFYRRDIFKALHTQWIPVQTNLPAEFSRDILYVKGVFQELDTVHIFVNHWPSKFGGEKISGPKRLAAANALATICDSILQTNSKANILAMGDFNDTPDSKAFEPLKNLIQLNHNIDSKNQQEKPKGTLKYRGVWEKIDHFFVSKNILNQDEPISLNPKSAATFAPKYLLEKDKTHTGTKPRRTYIGPRYNGGLSDHLPIILKIERNW